MQPASAAPNGPEPPAPRRGVATSLVIGVAALAVLAALLLLAVLQQRDGSNGAGSPSAEASPGVASPGASQISTSPPSSVAASPGAALAPDDLVRTTVEGLTLRAEPGTSGQRLGTLATDSISFLMMGPVQPGLDGHDWYLVSGLGLPPATGCLDPVRTDPYECPIWLGYVAGADTDGTPWLATFDAACADPPPDELEALTLGHPSLELLHCYGDRELVFRAWWPGQTEAPACEATDGPLWLLCPEVPLGWSPEYPEAIRVALDPASGVSTPEGEGWVEVTAQFDHVESARCAQPADANAEDLRIILGCRATLVTSAMQHAP